jgi:hypothetical protein
MLFRKQRSGGPQLEASLVKQFMRPYLEKLLSYKKIGLVEWLKV